MNVEKSGWIFYRRDGYMSSKVLWFIILIEGFVTISAEILTIRQLVPIVGSSVIVTSLIIGVFLLFLAYGYRRGGQYQKNYMTILKNNFAKSALWLGMGLSYVFVVWFFRFFNQYISHNILFALSSYLLLITAPLVYILGQTVPITMNLMKQETTTGATGGKVLHLSTLGSFLGSILTSVLLLNYVGVAWAVLINFCLLFILTFILFSKEKQDALRIVFLSVALVGMYGINVTLEKQYFVHTNAYSNYAIMSDANAKVLLMNGSYSSLLTSDKKGFPYIEVIKKIIFDDLNLNQKDILVLGAGGFTLSADGTHGNRFTFVDIDSDIKNIVKKYFLEKISGEIIIKDARTFLNTTTRKFDVIVSDVYSNRRSIPTHLLTQEYFLSVKKSLQTEGIAIFNIIAHPTLNDDYSRRIDNTLRSVFNHCMSIPLQYTTKPSNIIYVCQPTLAHEKGELYTDNQNVSTLDFFKEPVDLK